VENFQPYQQEETIDLKALFFKFTRFWYLFAISVFIALLVAFLFNKYTKPVYEVKTSVLVKDQKGGKMDATALLGLNFGGQQNLQNEIGVLMSYSLSFRTIKEMNFEVSYFNEDGFITKEMYKTSPFIVEVDFGKPQSVSLPYTIRFKDNNTFLLEAEGENITLYDFKAAKPTGDKNERLKWSGEYRFGDWIDNGFNRFRILLNDNLNLEEVHKGNLSFVLNDYQSLLRVLRRFQD